MPIIDPDMIMTLYLCVWLALAGAALGSFLDCAVWRYVEGERMFAGRSRCASCGATLRATELIPVFSYLFSRGRCRHCREKIPAECLWAELAGAIGFVCFGLHFGLSAELFFWLAAGVPLLALSLVDAKTQIIPDILLLAMAACRAAAVLALHPPLWATAKTALISLCAGPLPLLFLTLLMEWLLGRELMGGGDIKLLMAFALYLEWPQMALTLILGCVLGILGAVFFKKKGAFAFGPYLAAAFVAVVCFGSPFLAWYLGLLGRS